MKSNVHELNVISIALLQHLLNMWRRRPVMLTHHSLHCSTTAHDSQTTGFIQTQTAGYSLQIWRRKTCKLQSGDITLVFHIKTVTNTHYRYQQQSDNY